MTEKWKESSALLQQRFIAAKSQRYGSAYFQISPARFSDSDNTEDVFVEADMALIKNTVKTQEMVINHFTNKFTGKDYAIPVNFFRNTVAVYFFETETQSLDECIVKAKKFLDDVHTYVNKVLLAYVVGRSITPKEVKMLASCRHDNISFIPYLQTAEEEK